MKTEGHERLRMWTVYERPLDFPQGYVAREWLVTKDGEKATDTVIHGETLDQIQAFFVQCYPHLIFMQRSENDEPHIVGTWL